MKQRNHRQRLAKFLEAPLFQRSIIILIFLNAVTLGLEALPTVKAAYGTILLAFDSLALGIFTLELALRLYAYRLSFFKGAWNWFDFIIVTVSLIPANEGMAVLRALRILRALRLVSAVPSMRRVVEALLGAMPGMASIIGLLSLILYISAVMATKLFATTAPQYFGDLWLSLFTMFQIMTMEAWAEITRQIMATQPMAWIFFVIYILISTFAVLNLFIAVVVNAMQENFAADNKKEQAKHDKQQHDTLKSIDRRLQRLEKKLLK